MRRRQLLLAAGVGGAGMLWGLRAKNSDNGGVPTVPTFQTLSTALDKAGLARPTLVIDKQKLLANAAVLHQHLAGQLRLSRGSQIAALTATVGNE